MIKSSTWEPITLLIWLMSFKNLEGQTTSWIQRLQEYNFTSEHRQGPKHNNADGLTQPVETEAELVS
jgi:hypothetical protein